MNDLELRCQRAIRWVPNFPQPGIQFADLSGLWGDPALGEAIEQAMASWAREILGPIDAVVAVESRGFFLGVGLARVLKVPFVAVRKAGKLPGPVVQVNYALEYGEGRLELQVGSIPFGGRVLIHDDVLATGGTACAAAELVRLEGGRVAGFAFLLEISGLGGRANCEKVAPVVRPLLPSTR